ncbi:MAG TPA: RNB domain-containing ribonuclease [Burkholderiaceae bacterium]|nr:RNB domain-containing ribonuclease [Burkholderiaceae bacterium]
MNLFFEEDGAFKAGTVLSATDAAFQVELPSGKRTKVKSAQVLLRFEAPSPVALLAEAQAQAETLDLDFLWEVAPQDEFGFLELAREYYGAEPSPAQAAATLLRLHGAPVYFHRKGRGRFRPAPADILKAALVAVERKRQQEALRQEYVAALKGGVLPEVFRSRAVELLVRPDKNGIEWKALEQAAADCQMTPLRLLLARGALASPYRWHLANFDAQYFPRGTGFAADLPAPAAAPDLPLAAVPAFSIDDSATTEIDDAFSVERLPEGRVRVGIHIAAPALGIARGHALDAVARARMSTVYAPGIKITMLPDEWVAAYSLGEGREVPVLSLYAVVNEADHALLATETRVERVRIAANLRHDRLDAVITDEAIERGAFDAPFASELAWLWRWARSLMRAREQVRGRPEPVGRLDWSYELEGEAEDARVSLKARRRGSPLDLVVSELMILANSTWGEWLARHQRIGIYRSQRMGRVRMSTTPAPHEGIGVAHYAWSTSPLRRYVDLVNQRQLVALALGQAAPYPAGDADVFAIVSAFDAAYTAYAEFQARMERYWGLRWIEQEAVKRIGATVIKEEVLRLEGLPFVQRLPGLPVLARGQKVELDVLGTDLVDLVLEARLRQVLEQQAPDDAVGDEDEALALADLEDAGAAPAPGPAPDPAVAAPAASDESGAA